MLAIVASCVAQSKKDIVKAKPDTLDIRVIPKEAAVKILGAMNIAFAASAESDKISAKQANEAAQIYNIIAANIYRKWPDLQPKPQVQK